MIQADRARHVGTARAKELTNTERSADEDPLEYRGLCPLWYVRKRLEEEIERSRRAGHHLSVVTLGPTRDASQALLAAAAAAVQTSARASDIVGWIDKGAIVVVMPDADESGSLHAAKRWTSQIWLKTMHLGAVKWEAFILKDVSSYQTPGEVLDAAVHGLGILIAPRRW
jgi:GGDEF domain-containing protein